MSTVVKLVEYEWDPDQHKYVSSGNVFTFDPPPSSIQKNVKCEWRIKHIGKNELKKFRWRFRRTSAVKLRGVLHSEDDRLKLEALGTRNSLFKLEIPFQEPATIEGPEGEDKGSDYPPTARYGYFIITEMVFQGVPGQNDIQYEITLERVREDQVG